MLYTVIRILVIALCCTAAGIPAMHLLQFRSYQRSELRRALSLSRDRLMWINFPVAVGATAINWYMPVLFSMFMPQNAQREALCNWLMLPLFIGATALARYEKDIFPVKRAFTVSQRMGRLMVLVLAINALGATVFHVLTLSPYLMFAANDYVVLLAAHAIEPVEKQINAKYYRAARLKLAEHKKLLRIGISGSFGKTETKLILHTILSEKYRVLVTPPSFSSAMGASRIINEQLSKKHQVFIAELGGQRKGDVRETARVIRPQFGILTCVGPAHLDSYGSLKLAAEGQYELMQNLTKGGAAFFGADGGFGNRLYALCPLEKYRASLDGDAENYMRATHLEINERGSQFELSCTDGEHIWVQTKLLGSYAARNIALAAAVAHKLGMSMEEIRGGIGKIRPLRGHLQLVPGKINQIDDSLNTLSEAALEAVRILSEFPGRRIIVISGFNELDPAGAQADYQLGIQIALNVDFAIVVGANETKQLRQGIARDPDFPESSLRVVEDVEAAMSLVEDLAESGDSVLWEGIAPEYEEE